MQGNDGFREKYKGFLTFFFVFVMVIKGVSLPLSI
jgi:hypothetical protein